MTLRHWTVLVVMLLGSLATATRAHAEISDLKVTATAGGGDFGQDQVDVQQVQSLAVIVTFSTAATETAGVATADFVGLPVGITLACEETTQPGDLRRTFKCSGLFPVDTFVLFPPGGYTVTITAEAIDEFSGIVVDVLTRPLAVNIVVPDIKSVQDLVTRMEGLGLIAGSGAKGLVSRLQRRLQSAQNAEDAGAFRAAGRNIASFREDVRRQTGRLVDPSASTVLRLDANALIALINPNRR